MNTKWKIFNFEANRRESGMTSSQGSDAGEQFGSEKPWFREQITRAQNHDVNEDAFL